MQFERTHLRERSDDKREPNRVWDGFVHGHPECWVVVAPSERDLLDWYLCEAVAVESTPLRICRAILDDDVLVLEASDAVDGELFSELP